MAVAEPAEVDTVQIRRDLDAAIAAALPVAGGRVQKLLRGLKNELARLDAMRTQCAKHRVRGASCQRCGQEDVDGVRWVDMVDQCVADVCPVRDGVVTRPSSEDGS